MQPVFAASPVSFENPEKALRLIPYSVALNVNSKIVATDIHQCLNTSKCSAFNGSNLPNYCPGSTEIQVCVQVFESEEKCRRQPLNIYVDKSFLFPTNVIKQFYEEMLFAFNSPAIREDPNIAKTLIESAFSFGVKNEKVIDPLIALAFFRNESNFGVNGGRAAKNNAIGNIREPSSQESRSFCTNGFVDGYCSYASWSDSVRHWFWLIGSSGIYVTGNPSTSRETVDEIYPVYAPVEDNNPVPEKNIQNAKNWVCHWRPLLQQYKAMHSQTT